MRALMLPSSIFSYTAPFPSVSASASGFAFPASFRTITNKAPQDVTFGLSQDVAPSSCGCESCTIRRHRWYVRLLFAAGVQGWVLVVVLVVLVVIGGGIADGDG